MSEGMQETKRIFCNVCNGYTNHLLRAKYSRRSQDLCPVDEVGERCNVGDRSGPHHGLSFFWSPDLGPVKVFDTGEVRTSIWSCAGCDCETFESEFMGEGEEHGEIEYFPKRSGNYIQKKHFVNLNAKLSRLYPEVISSFNEGCLLLCTIGLRALIEGICADKGITDGKLGHKIDGLVKFAPSANLIEALHEFRFAGNEAAHELQPLTQDEASSAIEIIEDLLNFLYALDYKASQVRQAKLKSAKLGSVQ